MQIVIDIPDAFYEIYNSIDLSDKHWDEKYYVYGIAYSLLVGLQDGQPLPKGHGDLIDRSKLVPVTPAEKVGYWIDTGSGQECSECGEIQYGYDNFRKYCANCGAKMNENKEDTKKAIKGFTEFFKGITGNQNIKIPKDIAKKYGIEQDDASDNLESEVEDET